MKLVPANDPALRRVSDGLFNSSTHIRYLVGRMFEIVEHNNAQGLAAPQVGVNLQIFVTPPFKIVTNPTINQQSAIELTIVESCLSLPGITIPVKRPQWIEVSYCTLGGKHVHEKLWGLEARVFMHEFDHLLGKLIIDYE